MYPRKTIYVLTAIYISAIVLADYLGYFNKIPKDDVFNLSGQQIKIKAVVISHPKKLKIKTSFVVKAKNRIDNNEDVSGKVLVNYFFPRYDLKQGDEIELEGRVFRHSEALNPGEFDYKKYLYRRRIYTRINIGSHKKIKRIGEGKISFFSKSLNVLREEISERLRHSSGNDSSRQVLSGIILGEKASLPDIIYRNFIGSGIVHVLAVSGLHVGLVLFIFWNFFYWMRLPKKNIYIFTIAVVFVYVNVTGAHPSAVRAFLMSSMALLAYAFGREKNIRHSLFVSCLIILLINPQDLFAIGFQFSFLATIGLLYLSAPIKKMLFFLPKWLQNTLSISLGAQIMISPVVAYYFNRISLIAPISNIFVVPLIGIIVALGFSSLLLSLVSNFLAEIIGKIINLCVYILLKEADFFSSFSFSSVQVVTPSFLFLVLFYSFILCCINYKYISKIFGKIYAFKKAMVYIIIAGICIGIYINCFVIRSKELKITLLALKNSDSIFLEFPDGKNMLIDTGKSIKNRFDVGEKIIVPFLLNKRIKKIDTIIITRDHYSHTGGLGAILKSFRVGEVIFNSKIEPFRNPFIFRRVKTGDYIKEENEIKIKVINPAPNVKNRNNNLVLHLVYNEFSFLFTGDIGKNAQKIIISKYNLKSKFLHVPYYGKNELAKNFLWEIFPECGIITTLNKANKALLNQLNAVNRDLKIYTTKEWGAIEISTSGQGYRVKGYKKI